MFQPQLFISRFFGSVSNLANEIVQSAEILEKNGLFFKISDAVPCSTRNLDVSLFHSCISPSKRHTKNGLKLFLSSISASRTTQNFAEKFDQPCAKTSKLFFSVYVHMIGLSPNLISENFPIHFGDRKVESANDKNIFHGFPNCQNLQPKKVKIFLQKYPRHGPSQLFGCRTFGILYSQYQYHRC